MSYRTGVNLSNERTKIIEGSWFLVVVVGMIMRVVALARLLTALFAAGAVVVVVVAMTCLVVVLLMPLVLRSTFMWSDYVMNLMLGQCNNISYRL